MTVLDLITLALKTAGITGVGQSATAEDSNDVFTLANMMLAQWAIKRWMVYAEQDVSLTSTGAASYTYGTGGDFNEPYTDHLEGGYFRLLNQNAPQNPDFPLRLITSYEDWGRIRLKSLETFQQYVWFDGNYPLANVWFWPIPQAGLYQLHLLTKIPLNAFTSLTQTISLPPQYQAAILYNLAVRIRVAYQMQPDPMLIRLAQEALNTIKDSNAQIPLATMPSELSGNLGGAYNIFSDQMN